VPRYTAEHPTNTEQITILPCIQCVLDSDVGLEQRRPTGGPRLDLLRPPPNHRFGSIGESFNICLIFNVKFKHVGLNAVVFSRFVTDSVGGGGQYSLAALLKETLDLAFDGILVKSGPRNVLSWPPLV
jgi:hypothetical protein